MPLMISTALSERALPIYGDGRNVRDWPHVDDHCRALRRVLEAGRVGETYDVGGDCEKSNLEVLGWKPTETFDGDVISRQSGLVLPHRQHSYRGERLGVI
jgi:dTDP-D-glucose 4,6-dehydratase